MKKLLTLLLMAITINVSAQNEEEGEEKRGFDKNRMFLGGSVNLGFGSGSFAVGANPQVGYSLTNWLDAGITTNIIYSSQRYVYSSGFDVRQRSWNYGGGPFIKIFPVNFIHLQAQYEYNWITGNAENLVNGFKEKFSIEAPSLLVGAGYGQRMVGNSSFFTTILFDVTRHENSPYVLVEGQSKTALPIVRAGFTFYLGQRRR